MTETHVSVGPGTSRTGREERSALPAWLRQTLPGLVVALVAIRVLMPVKDPDTFWHIAAGRHLQESWDFVLADPFGATAEKQWILNQWAPELVMHWAESLFGLAGVAWLVSLATAALLVVLWVACRRRSSALVSAAVMAASVLVMSASISPRPQMVTFVLTVVAVDAWLRTAADGKPRWWLVPLSWAWACSHGMWFMGAAVGAAVVLGLALERRTPASTLGRLALIPVLSVVAAALTPAGPALLLSPFQVGEITGFITEWQPAQATDPSFVAACGLLVLVVVWLARSRDRRRWPVVLLVALAAALMFMSLRTVAVAGAVLAPVAAQALQELSGLPRERVGRPEKTRTAVLTVLALALAALIASSQAGAAAIGRSSLDTSLERLPEGTVICNDQIDGGWLIWRHPNVQVTIDTRAEIYSADHIRRYLDFMAARPGWDTYPAGVGCTSALLSKGTPVVEALTSRLHWTVVDEDGSDVLLEAPSG